MQLSGLTIFKNASYLSIMEVITLVTPFIALPYIFDTIGLGNYGKIVFARSVIAILALIVNWGLDTYIIKEVSYNREDKCKLGSIISSVVFIKLTIFIICLCISVMILPFFEFFRTEKLLMCAVLSDLLFPILVPSWFFQGIEKMKFLTIFKFINVFIYLILLFTFLKKVGDYWMLPLLQNVGLLLCVVFSIYVIYKKEKIPLIWPKLVEAKEYFIRSFPFFVSRAVNTVNSYIAKIVTGACLSMETVSIFDIAQKIISAAEIPSRMLNQAVYPSVAYSKDLSQVKTFNRLFYGLAILLCLILIFLSPLAVNYFIDTSQDQTVKIIRILCIYLLFSSITPFMGTSVLLSFGYEKEFNLSVILSSIATILLYSIVFLFKLYDIEIFALILCFSELLIYLLRLYYCKKYKLL